MNSNNFNERQKEAVLARGIVRVIAGAGSGKTRVLTYRIGYLISEGGISPSNILAVTFTRKAAIEMKERLKRLIGIQAEKLICGTFHSICYQILRESPGQDSFKILDDRGRKTYLKRVLGPEGLNITLEVGKVGSIISMAKNRLIDAEGFSREAEDFFSRRVADVFSLYEDWKERDHLMDYDDLLLKCWKILKTDRKILSRYRQRFDHILVDEAQDTNMAQFEIIKLLTPPQNNLFITGDDWQSIYGWRGAEPENIIEFDRIFPNTTTVKLEQNYRSTKTIVERSNRLISFNEVRTDKKLWTANSKGPEIEIIEARDTDEEAALILEKLRSLIGKTSFKDISILYRTNAQSRALEDECIRQKIPYQVIGSLSFYDRREIKDIIAYLRLVHNPDDDEALLRIINVPPRYLGKAFLKELEGYAHSRKRSLFVSLDGYFSRPYMTRSAGRFHKLILDLIRYYQKNITLSDLVRKIRKLTDYDQYICQDEEITPDDSRIQNLNELESALARFEKIEDFLFYVEQVEVRKLKNTDHDQVSLMTLHKSKGLEFPVVFITGCSQGLLPHHKVLDDGGLEEERRLCYVGMTRAKERLCISCPRTYQGKQLVTSRFLKEVFPEFKTAGGKSQWALKKA